MNITILVLAIAISLVIVYFLSKEKKIITTTTTTIPSLITSTTSTTYPVISVYFENLHVFNGNIYNYITTVVGINNVLDGHLVVYTNGADILISSIDIVDSNFSFINLPILPYNIPCGYNEQWILRFNGNLVPGIYSSVVSINHNGVDVINPYEFTIQIEVI